MDKFKRRQFLLGGVSAGTAVTLGTEHIRRQRARAQQAAIDAYVAEFYDPDDLIQAAVNAETQLLEELQALKNNKNCPM